MAGCGCGKNKTKAGAQSYVHTLPSGERKAYKSEVEAVAAAQRQGGTVRAQ